MRIFLAGVLACIIGLIVSSTGQADIVAGQSVGLDFGNNAGAGATPASFNAITNSTAITDLNDTLEMSTGVGLTLASADATPVNFFNAGVHQDGSPNSLVPTSGATSPFTLGVIEDWSGVVNGDGYVITFTNLTAPDVTYDLAATVGAWTNNGVTDNLELTVDGQTLDLGDQGTDPRFGTLTGLSADGSGNLQIVITAEGGATDVPVISGLYLTAVATAVPEPSSLALLGLGAIGLVVRRKRN